MFHFNRMDASGRDGDVRPVRQEADALVSEAYGEMSRTHLQCQPRLDSSVQGMFGDLVLVDDEISHGMQRQEEEFAGALEEIEKEQEAREEEFPSELFGIFMGPLVGTSIGRDIGATHNQEDESRHLQRSRIKTWPSSVIGLID